MTFCCAEGGLPFVALTNTNIVISGSDIEFGEQRVSLEFFGDVFNVWNRVLIPDRSVVDGSIVLYWAIGSILFFDTEGARGVWGFRWFNVSFRKLFFCPFVHELGFRGTEGVNLALEGVGGVGF